VKGGLRERLARLLEPRAEAFGLEIGTAMLKAVDLQPGNPPTLAALAQRPTPQGVLRDDAVIDVATLANELRALVAEAGIRRKQVVAAVPNRQAITRVITMPTMSRKELAEAIRWEAERYLPFPVDEVELDFAPLDDPATTKAAEIEVLLVAARTDLLAGHVEALRQAGLEPVALDVKPFALLRSLKGALLGAHLSKATLAGSGYTEANEIGVVLEIAASATTITLVRGDRVLMNRNVGVCGDDFTAAMQRAFSLEFDAAEEAKILFGTAAVPGDDDLLDFDVRRETFRPTKVHDALRPVLIELTSEIRRSLEFFRVQSGDALLTRMVITGGGAQLRGLAEAIGDALGVRTVLGDPWLTVLSDAAKFPPERLTALAPSFGVALGLAHRGVLGRD
jgi:type IV pilus assembly protein PilM